VTAFVGLSLLVTFAIIVIAIVVSWHEVTRVAPRSSPGRTYSLTEILATEDGAFIELRRLPAPVEPVDLPPVLCVHGIGIDHHNNDMFEDRSVARHLHRRGRDVWLLTLRSGVRGTLRRNALTTFDRMARYDLPLAVREVLERTKSAQLDYVGFSMGGMLAYAALPSAIPKGSVRRVAIMGSPGRVDVADAPTRWLAKLTPIWMVPEAPLEPLSRLVGRVAGILRTPIHHRVINPDNMAPGDYRAALATISTIPRPLLADFARFVRTGEVTFEGKSVLAALADLDVPVHFVAGSRDRIAQPDHVKAAHDAWGSNGTVEKVFWIAGPESGAEHAYGHGDLAMGVRVDVEVLQRIGDFLSRP
jgi:pimeloyl-ACP methyl ester carboxylesterase